MAQAAASFGPNDPGATDPKIFVIGLNRCGTRSLHELFGRSGISSVHWQRESDRRNLAQAMLTNLALGLPPFAGFEAFRAFSDLSHVSDKQVIEGALHYRSFEAAYPGAYFILNTRPVDGWIASRLKHAGGHFLTRSMAASGLSEPELVARWRELWQRHHDDVTAHFAGKPRFLTFDITEDGPEKIAAFLAPDFTLDPAQWRQTNRSGPMARPVRAEGRPTIPLGG